MKKSNTDLKRLRDLPEDRIDYSDIPDSKPGFWEEAEIIYPQKKIPVSIRIDEEVISWFKKYGKGYQSRINAVLRSYMMHIKSKN